MKFISTLTGECPACGAEVKTREYQVNFLSLGESATSRIVSTCANEHEWFVFEEHAINELAPTYAADLEANGIRVEILEEDDS